MRLPRISAPAAPAGLVLPRSRRHPAVRLAHAWQTRVDQLARHRLGAPLATAMDELVSAWAAQDLRDAPGGRPGLVPDRPPELGASDDAVGLTRHLARHGIPDLGALQQLLDTAPSPAAALEHVDRVFAGAAGRHRLVLRYVPSTAPGAWDRTLLERCCHVALTRLDEAIVQRRRDQAVDVAALGAHVRTRLHAREGPAIRELEALGTWYHARPADWRALHDLTQGLQDHAPDPRARSWGDQCHTLLRAGIRRTVAGVRRGDAGWYDELLRAPVRDLEQLGEGLADAGDPAPELRGLVGDVPRALRLRTAHEGEAPWTAMVAHDPAMAVALLRLWVGATRLPPWWRPAHLAPLLARADRVDRLSLVRLLSAAPPPDPVGRGLPPALDGAAGPRAPRGPETAPTAAPGRGMR